MTYSVIQSVGLAALSVAMRAKTKQLDPMDVTDVYSKAEQLLAHDHPLFRAVSAFATHYEWHRHDLERVQDLGAELSDAVQIAVRPDPVDAGRKDIHG